MSVKRRAAELVEDDTDGELEQSELDEEEAPSSAKRQRAGTSTYPRGTVKQVKVFNFMTYGEPAVTITPGPRLNLVLGPNGTGKSSLVCALCVGLGGSTKLLGRADNVKDYIRRGADRGWVETTLSGGPGHADIVIRCEMSKTEQGYSTAWKINRVTKTKREVSELVTSLNIQFDNLCQFLPQDKVVEFARMDQYELLVATEKAIGDASLHETHMQLIDKRVEVKQKDVAAAADQKCHEQLVAENQKLERDYERFKRRKNLQDRVAMMKKKHAWMGVKELQEKAKAAEDQAKEAAAAYNQAKAEAGQDVQPLKRRQQEADAAKKKTADLLQAIKAKEREVKAAADKVVKEEDNAREARNKLNGLQQESDKLAEEKEKLRAKLSKIEDMIAKLPPTPDHSAEQQQLSQQMKGIHDQISNLETDMQLLNERGAVMRQQAQVTAELRQCDSAKYLRLQALRNRHGYHTLDNAAQWVEQQKAAGRFKGDVVGPLGLEMQIKLTRYAHYLEQATFFNLCDFVTEYKEDTAIIADEFKKFGDGVRSSIITLDADAEMPHSDAAQCSAYGVMCSLDDVYHAPPLVKKALANLAGLDKFYVVEHNDVVRVQKLMEDKGIRRVFTPQNLVTYHPSAYGGKADASIQIQRLYQPRVLGGASGSSDERKQQLQAQLQQVQARVQQIDEQQAQSDSQKATLQQQLDELQKRRQALVNEVQTANRRRNQLAQAQKLATTHLGKMEQVRDPLLDAPKLERQLQKALAAHHAALTAQLEGTLAQWQLLQQYTVAEMAWRELDMQARAMQAAVDARRNALRGLEQAAQRAASQANVAKNTYRAAREKAQEEHPIDAEAKKRFEQMPDDREELQAEIDKLEEQIVGIAVNNPRVVEEYRKRLAEIDKLDKDISKQQEELDALRAEIDELKERWLPELQRVVGLINTSFASNFSQIGCAGEVLLGQHEDYDKFSIQIKVKFRESEQLELLTAHRQSGGERSVSTILYLIALQGVTVTPFRVVDEINQGMDPVNERKVFMQLVDASCQEGTPQCFLLTPKLLPDLPFTEDITVLNIFNGGLISQQVAGQYSRKMLFGASWEQQLHSVPVVG